MCAQDVGRISLCSEDYLHPVAGDCDFVQMKAHLVVRLIEHAIGKDLFLEVLHQVLKRDEAAGTPNLLTTADFFKMIKTGSNQDMKALRDRYVEAAGCGKAINGVIVEELVTS